MARSLQNRVTMRLLYIDSWSALKVGFVFSLFIAAVVFLFGIVFWVALNVFGIIDLAQSLMSTIVGEEMAKSVLNLNFFNVTFFFLAVALLQIVVISGFCAIWATLVSVATQIVDGWKLTFSSE